VQGRKLRVNFVQPVGRGLMAMGELTVIDTTMNRDHPLRINPRIMAQCVLADVLGDRNHDISTRHDAAVGIH
jgi:hypothetical protein